MTSLSQTTPLPLQADASQVPASLPYLLAALSMMGPFSVDTYLPSFHAVERELHASNAQVQQTLTAFLIPFAFMSLWHGALSDSYGRRRVVLLTLAVMVLSSLGCALAPTIEVLWVCRVVQGLSAGIFVIGRAVVRDVYEGPKAQQVIAQVSVLFALGPALAPIIGGQLQALLGWRSVFYFLVLFAGGIWVWSLLNLPETHPPARRHPFRAPLLLQAYGEALRHPRFMAAALAAALNFMAIFVYVATAPALLLQHLHVPETQFFWLFGPLTIGMMLGGFLAGRLAEQLNPRQTLGASYVLMGAATVVNVTFHLLHAAALPWSVLTLFFYAVGMALAMPTLSLMGLEIFPQRRGMASSCQAFLLTGGNALVAGLLATWAAVAPVRMACAAGAFWLAGLACVPFLGLGRQTAAVVESSPVNVNRQS